MSLDLEKTLANRNQIARCFPAPIEMTPMIAEDVNEHRYWLGQRYRYLLHDQSVIPECCQRFEQTFMRRPDWELVILQ